LVCADNVDPCKTNLPKAMLSLDWERRPKDDQEAPVAPFGGLSSALLLGLGASLSLGLCSVLMPPLSALSVPGGFATKTLIGFCGLAGCFGFVMAETVILRSAEELSCQSRHQFNAITLQVFGALTLLPVSSHVAAQHYLAKLAALAANMWLMRSARCLMLEVDKQSKIFVRCWGKHQGQRTGEMSCVDRYSAFLTGGNVASNAVVAKTGSQSFAMFSAVWFVMTACSFSPLQV